MSTRAFSSNPKAYKTFENRAVQLANDLRNDFTFETAVGYELLAMHTWSECESVFKHYRDHAISILSRVYASRSHDPYSTCRMMIASAILSSHLDYGVVNDVMKVTEMFQRIAIEDHNTYDDGDTIDISRNSDVVAKPMIDDDALACLRLRISLGNFVFKDDNALDNDRSPTKYLPLSELNNLLALSNKTTQIFAYSPTLSRKSLITAGLFNASALYAAGKKEESLKEISNLLYMLDTSEIPFNIMGPMYIDFFHFIFKIAFVEKEYSLANRISGYQRKLAVFMPSAVSVMEDDMNLLRNISSEKNDQNDIFSLPQPQLCTIPQSPIYLPSSLPFYNNTPLFNTPIIPALPSPITPEISLDPEEESFIAQVLNIPYT
eukprot:CAMPEP_0206157922 /NCGR_PEP_ID=MMETSP1474-20131121/4361_1 /ASSEMBLY_ACC=CAM_ASM_001110 /TAXON_ID=97495 /ORGANISM="Imantonia sp., Strain RCC918" /LENGTH=376 /DNA_ID=CAMNT_0053557733 /DNA_START=351 /DNA_END=1481 /DNA_ORIENTATION=+